MGYGPDRGVKVVDALAFVKGGEDCQNYLGAKVLGFVGGEAAFVGKAVELVKEFFVGKQFDCFLLFYCSLSFLNEFANYLSA